MKIILSFDEDEKSKYKYLAEIPSIDGITQGESWSDALDMALDYIKENNKD